MHLNGQWDKIIIGVYSTPTSMLAIEYLRFRNQPFYIEADGGIIHKDSVLKYKIKHHFISSASGWLSSGNRTTDYLVHYGADREKCYFFPFSSLTKQDLENGISMARHDKKSLKNAVGIKEEKMLLTVGKFTYDRKYGIRKGYHALMRAAEKLSGKIGIYIVGDEPTEEFLEWKKQKKLNHVHFIGFKTKEELKTYYAAADIFILMTRYDIWGLVINEAMSFGLPVITTNQCIAGLELIKDDSNGYIVPVDDDMALVEKVNGIINDEEILKKFGETSLNIIQDYSIENMAEEHINILSLC